MRRKVSPADQYRNEPLAAVGAASLDFSGCCRLAAQAMLQGAVEIEVEEFVGRGRYERRDREQSIYRNGYKRRRVATGEGAVELQVPQTRDGAEPFHTAILDAYRRRSETLEALIPTLFVKGLSVRDVSDTFKQVFEDEGVSPATASRVSQQIYEDFDKWRKRSLAGVDLLYLFVDGMYLKLEPQRVDCAAVERGEQVPRPRTHECHLGNPEVRLQIVVSTRVMIGLAVANEGCKWLAGH